MLAAVTVAAGTGVLTGPKALTVIGGLLLAFGLPGFALTTAVFRERISLAPVERLMLVPALSLATLVLGGIVAWVAGLPLHRWTWLGISGVVTLVALATTVIWPVPVPTAAATAAKLPTPEDSTVVLPVTPDRERTLQQEPPGWWSRLIPAQPAHTLVPFVLTGLLLGGAGWFSVWTSKRTHDVTVTALSAAPPSSADNLGDRTVTVTATGLTATGAPYALAVISPVGDETFRQALTPDPKGAWTGTVTVPDGERTTIGLFRSGDTTAYRTVIIAAR